MHKACNIPLAPIIRVGILYPWKSKGSTEGKQSFALVSPLLSKGKAASGHLSALQALAGVDITSAPRVSLGISRRPGFCDSLFTLAGMWIFSLSLRSTKYWVCPLQNQECEMIRRRKLWSWNWTHDLTWLGFSNFPTKTKWWSHPVAEDGFFHC